MSEIPLLHVPRQLVIFRVGETHYGIDIEAVDEILPMLHITGTPGAPAGVLGFADVRKQVVPVFDLHVRFGVQRPADSAETRLILVEAEDGPVAMLVDAVEEVLNVKREDFQSVATPGSTASIGYLNGVVRRDDRLLLWIDHHRLIPRAIIATAA